MAVIEHNHNHNQQHTYSLQAFNQYVTSYESRALNARHMVDRNRSTSNSAVLAGSCFRACVVLPWWCYHAFLGFMVLIACAFVDVTLSTWLCGMQALLDDLAVEVEKGNLDSVQLVVERILNRPNNIRKNLYSAIEYVNSGSRQTARESVGTLSVRGRPPLCLYGRPVRRISHTPL